MRADDTIGIAIATHNSEKQIGGCLAALGAAAFRVVIYDDASQDHTVVQARRVRPSVDIIDGTGDAWWGGGTRRAIDRCLALGCEYVLMLNPDAWIDADSVRLLRDTVASDGNTIAAAVVVRRDDPQLVAWAGSRWVSSPLGVPLIRRQNYLYRAGTPVAHLPGVPFATHEVHGRAVMVSSDTFRKVGPLDDRTFPHYGCDNDFAWRAHRAGVRMVVVPSAVVLLDTSNSGMASRTRGRLRDRLRRAHRYLTDKKSGDAIRVTWRLYSRHHAWYSVLPSVARELAAGMYHRLWTR
ncbi:MAG: glycosyltransferase family 2 protein [Myxococcales bacterium]|nr:glycosyltransferase family 2 protein [Myxococcales bacterium]